MNESAATAEDMKALPFWGPNGSLAFLLISFLLLLLPLPRAPTTAAANLVYTPIKANCTGGTFAGNTPFQANLKTLFSSLTSQSSTYKSANASSGAAPDRTYGLYLCEGDLAPSDCQACISTAVTNINQSCPSTRQGIIWYDYCLLRYSDANFFGVPDTNGFSMVNPYENTSSTQPLETVTSLVQVAPLRQPLMFASKSSLANNLFAMAQCTVDLSSNGCSRCLTTILADITACCTGAKGWRYLSGSCWIRYEATPFLQDQNGQYTEVVQEKCSYQNFPPTSLGMMTASLTNLLSNVTSKARPTGFYNTTTGEDPNRRLYGLALCRADLLTPGDDCTSCLNDTASTITHDCPNMTQGIKWYEKCLLRYSNQSFFGIVDDGGRTLCGQGNVTGAANDATFALASRLAGAAPNSPLMFAAGEATISDSQSSYVLVQCTRDLSTDGCTNCLQNGMSMLTNNCNQTNGWRYLSGSCTIRYEVTPFFNISAIASTPTSSSGRGGASSNVAAIVAPILGVILMGLFIYYLWWRSKRRRDRRRVELKGPLPSKDLPFMDLATIQAATNNFSDANKLGEGGFGPVYKGVMQGERDIAVKRLSKISKQGDAEFKNEVKLIAKLQHKNLVRMLGCCVEGEEQLLVYEYLPNRSLDVILFDPNKRSQLDWRRRHHIVAGIARGLLYLHEDSLLKVIHRDLKASNVLLDNEMNPKISDFGMAKIYEADVNEDNTERVVGTFGYMAPEYAMHGAFSVKSDVYSFGVLLLEILSGERNGRSHFEQHGQTLLRKAWQLWYEGKPMELMDPLLGGSYPMNEVIKLINIGLLCVQENVEERPTMFKVVHMIESELKVLPQPTQPPTFSQRTTVASDLTSSSSKTHSTNSRHTINEVTNTDVVPR